MNASSPRAFEDLTRRGRVGRQRALALVVLRDYDIQVKRCSFAAEAFNTVFRVDTVDGRSYALRMSPSLRIHADGCEETEAAWVTALRHDVDFATPAVIPARDGSVVVTAEDAGVTGMRTCVLFEWVPGRRLRDAITTEHVHRTGELAALTHEHGADYLSDPPAGALVAERVCYFEAPDRLEPLRADYGATLDEAVARAQGVLDALWRDPPHRPHLLHGDIQPGNVMVSRSEVVLIDFQDLIWGFEIQDVGFAVQALEQVGDDRHLGDDGSWARAFRSGYEAVRAWPEADRETIAALSAARHLNILNFGLGMGRPGLDEFVARHAAPVIAWMRMPERG